MRQRLVRLSGYQQANSPVTPGGARITLLLARGARAFTRLILSCGKGWTGLAFCCRDESLPVDNGALA
jgi:hypothetical protein